MTDKCRQCIDYDKDSETCRLDIKDEPCGWFVEKPSPWHTGTPTEEGYYLVHIILDDDEYDLCMNFKDGVWDERKWGFNALKVEIIAWQKITPFEADKENK